MEFATKHSFNQGAVLPNKHQHYAIAIVLILILSTLCFLLIAWK